MKHNKRRYDITRSNMTFSNQSQSQSQICGHTHTPDSTTRLKGDRIDMFFIVKLV